MLSYVVCGYFVLNLSADAAVKCIEVSDKDLCESVAKQASEEIYDFAVCHEVGVNVEPPASRLAPPQSPVPLARPKE